MTLVSRILGFLRDVIIARIFGATDVSDAFIVALKIPNFFRRLFAEGSFSLAFIPVFTEYKEQQPEHLKELVNRVSGTLLASLMVITALGLLFAPQIVLVFATGFRDDPEKLLLTGDMLRITFPYLLLISMTALAGSILNSFSRFWVPALTPALLNVCIITAALALSPQMDRPIVSLAWGVLIGGVLQLLIQIPALRSLSLLPKPSWGPADPGVRKIAKLMIPTLFGSSVAQINLLLDTWIASFLITGSVSWLYYSDRLLEFPLGIFAIALSTVILPKLASHYSKNDMQAFSADLNWALKLVLLFGLPASLGLFLLAEPIISTLFQYGKFTEAHTSMTALSLAAYATGLPAFIAIKILAPGYYARQDTKTPVKIGIIAMTSNMLLNIVFVLIWLQVELPGAHAALALASSVSAYLNAGLLYYGLRKQQLIGQQHPWKRLLLPSASALLVMGLTIYLFPVEVLASHDAFHRAIYLATILVVAILAYALSLFAMGIRPSQLRR